MQAFTSRLSRTLQRGFLFDRIRVPPRNASARARARNNAEREHDQSNPHDAAALDRVAALALGPIKICDYLHERMTRLLSDFGKKKELQRHGRYVLKP